MHGMRRTYVLGLVILGLLVGDAVRAAGPPVISSGNTAQRAVALTFDDGPSSYTNRVLGILNAEHIHATFFLVGQEVAADPAPVRAEVAAGNDVGNHTYTHTDLSRLSGHDAAVEAEVRRTQDAIRAAAGVAPHYFRSPYGAIDIPVATYINELGLEIVHWSVDPEDWAQPGVSVIV